MDPTENDLIGEPLRKVPEKAADYDCNARRTDDDGLFAGYCGARSGKGTGDVGEGRCSNHGGSGGASEGNDNAVTHGAYADLAKRPLIDGEKEAMSEAEEKLEDPADAKEIARTAASYCLMMGHRSQDPRWFRRFEGICDKFAIAPEEVMRAEVEHTGEVTQTTEVELDDNTRHVLDQMTGGDA